MVFADQRIHVCRLPCCLLSILLATFSLSRKTKLFQVGLLCSVTGMFSIYEAVDGDFKHHKKQNLHAHSLVLMLFFFPPNNCLVKHDGSVQLFSTECGPTESTLNIFLVFLREMNVWGEDSALNPVDGVLGH